MKLLTKTLCALLLGAPALLMAQSNTASPASALKMPTLEDLIPGGETYRYTENLYGLQWWGDTAVKPGIDSLVAIRPTDGRESLLFTRDDVNRVLEAEGLGKLAQLYVLSFPWADKTQALLSLHGKFITYGITFDVGKSTIKPESMGEINRIVTLMTENPDLKFSVEGHTDSTGNPTSNQTLSEQRSQAIVAKLVELGIAQNRLTAVGKGQNSPIADNNTDEGRAKNRRVEFVKQ